MRDCFSNCHPMVNFIFYFMALILGMCFIHPLFLCCSCFLSILYFEMLKLGSLKYWIGIGGLFFLIAFGNPLFSPYGDTVLFTYLNHRKYTYESLCFGFCIASMFVSMITWFATYHNVITSDKFFCCFGKFTPVVSLILTMVFRLVPSFQRKTKEIVDARKCIGMSMEYGTKYEKIQHGMTILSALTSWALEGGVVLADSMKSRGFGSGKRTLFSIYKMGKLDIYLLVSMLVMSGILIFCEWKGGMDTTYLPTMEIQSVKNPWTLLGLICYILFLAIPIGLHSLEEMIWHILKSKI